MKYRELKLGEIIQEGDEAWTERGWRLVVSICYGVPVEDNMRIRRYITTPEQAANIFRGKLADLMEECGVNGIYLDRTTGRIELDFEGGFLDLWEGYALTPESIRESITSPTQGATEES